jgi:hypothetical protein
MFKWFFRVISRKAKQECCEAFLGDPRRLGAPSALRMLLGAGRHSNTLALKPRAQPLPFGPPPGRITIDEKEGLIHEVAFPPAPWGGGGVGLYMVPPLGPPRIKRSGRRSYKEYIFSDRVGIALLLRASCVEEPAGVGRINTEQFKRIGTDSFTEPALCE